MSEMKIVGRGVDTLVLNVCYADKQFQPIKQELHGNTQAFEHIWQLLFTRTGFHKQHTLVEVDA